MSITVLRYGTMVMITISGFTAVIQMFGMAEKIWTDTTKRPNCVLLGIILLIRKQLAPTATLPHIERNGPIACKIWDHTHNSRVKIIFGFFDSRFRSRSFSEKTRNLTLEFRVLEKFGKEILNNFSKGET